MNRLLILLILASFVCLSCNAPQANKFDRLEWLSGNWERTNDKGNRKTFEYWNRESDEKYSGLGFTLSAQDTVFKEQLEIIMKNDTLNYKVTGVNDKPTYFKFTHQTDSSFVCENPANAYPQKIEYVVGDNIITATISGGGQPTSFIFKRM